MAYPSFIAHSSRSWLSVLATAFGFMLLLACRVEAVEVGDQVAFERAGQRMTGKVVSIRPGGMFVEVETQADGQARRLIMTASGLSVISNANAKPVRSWSDLTGNFRIEAALESQTPFDVMLRKNDGTLIKVPIDKLSIADQEFIATLETSPSANPFEAGVVGNVPSGSMPSSPSIPGPTNVGTSGALNLGTPTVFGGASSVIIASATPPTNYTPDPSPFDFSAIGTAALSIPEVEGNTDIGRPLFLTPSGTTLCYQARSSERRFSGNSSEQAFTKIFQIDGERRKVKMVGELQGASVWLCSANPMTGDVLGAVMKPGDDKSSSLCVISGIAQSQPRVVAHWRMYANDENAADYVRYRKLLSNKVAVVVYDGKVHAFDYETQQEIWTIPAPSFNEPAISPGGKYAACMIDRGCTLIETKTGDQIGSVPVEITGAVALGFSQDATKLAIAGGTQVKIYDVATASEIYSHEANVTLGSLGKPVFWLDADRLLLPTGMLLDIQRDLLLWNYNLFDDGIDYTDAESQGLLVFKAKDRMAIVRLPHTAALRASEGNTQDIVAVRGGDPVAIVANLGDPGASQPEITSQLATSLKQAGYKPSGSAATQFIATVKRESPKTEEYRIIGRGFSHEEVTFTPITSRVEFSQNGKVLWQRSYTTSLPFMLTGNQTLQDAAREAERPNKQFFEKLVLPKQILKVEYQSGFGTSMVSANGIVDTPKP